MWHHVDRQKDTCLRRAETEGGGLPCSTPAGLCPSGNSNASLLSSCHGDVEKTMEVLFLGPQINFGKEVDLQIRNPKIMRVNSPILFPRLCSIFSMGPVRSPFTYHQKGKINTSLVSVKGWSSSPLVLSWPTLAGVRSSAQLHR